MLATSVDVPPLNDIVSIEAGIMRLAVELKQSARLTAGAAFSREIRFKS